jgi:hypothetical protein
MQDQDAGTGCNHRMQARDTLHEYVQPSTWLRDGVRMAKQQQGNLQWIIRVLQSEDFPMVNWRRKQRASSNIACKLSVYDRANVPSLLSDAVNRGTDTGSRDRGRKPI